MEGIKEDSLRHKAACGPQILTVNFIHTALVPHHQIQGYLPQTFQLRSGGGGNFQQFHLYYV